MGTRDTRVDAYIARSADFAKPILNHIRGLVHTACPESEEALKWGFPTFVHRGIMCGMAAFKAHCSLGFWKHALILGKNQEAASKERDGMGHFGRITSLLDLPSDKTLLGYIREAARLNEAGIKPAARARPKTRKALVVPDFFLATLKKNEKALATFEGFSYSHKKEYIEWLTEAKREETRRQRLATAIQWLAAGKSRNWKYENC
jgi:uncharacterized protein YdeI (YjbR/CyaY-like superfamily)